MSESLFRQCAPAMSCSITLIQCKANPREHAVDARTLTPWRPGLWHSGLEDRNTQRRPWQRERSVAAGGSVARGRFHSEICDEP